MADIQQAGTVTPGHVAVWAASGVLIDAGVGATPQCSGLGVFGLGGTPFAIVNSAFPAPLVPPYTTLGFGIDNTAAYVTVSGGQNLPLNFVIGGNTVLSLTSTGASFGGVLGPAGGGTGTSVVPGAGNLLIGTTGGVYLPGTITAGPNILIGTSSGGITISAVNGVGGTLPVASGGTGQTALAVGALYVASANTITTGALPVALGGSGVTASTGTGNLVLSNSPTLVTPALGSIASGDLSNATHVPMGAASGILALANGGFGSSLSAPANGQIPIGNGTGFTLATLTAGSNISITNAAGSVAITATAGGISPSVSTITSSSTWTKPAGSYAFALIEIWGAGGGGGKVGSNYGAGGPGGYAWVMCLLTDLPGTVTATIGSGGSGGSQGGQGGTTSFGPYLSVSGGLGGQQTSTCPPYPAAGGAGALLAGASLTLIAAGGLGGLGGGVGGYVTNGTTVTAGAGIFGGAGGSIGNPGGAGTQPGGGGGQSSGGSNGGNGGNGQIRVTVF